MSMSNHKFNPEERIRCEQATNGEMRYYMDTASRREWFKSDYPNGAIRTTFNVANGNVIFKAEIFLDRNDEKPTATGHAICGITDSPDAFNSCETCAIGRALANAGYQIPYEYLSKNSSERHDIVDAPVPASQNVKSSEQPVPQKPVELHQQVPQQSGKTMAQQNPSSEDSNAEGISNEKMFAMLKTVIPFGKHKGETLNQIARTDSDFIRWIAEKYNPSSSANPETVRVKEICQVLWREMQRRAAKKANAN